MDPAITSCDYAFLTMADNVSPRGRLSV